MKPEDLKSPFTWEERHVLIKDRIWYVPNHYDRYEELIPQINPWKAALCS